VGAVVSRHGNVLVPAAQRSRILASAAHVVCEHGYGEMSVARITAGAGVSRRTFYDLFEDREACFLAAFDEAVAWARELMVAAYAGQRGWREQARAALLALLVLLDQEPALVSLLVTDALKAGPRVQDRRAQILEQLSVELHAGGARARAGRELPELTGEGVVGAVLGVIHTRVMARRTSSMVELLGPLMGMIVLPYLGAAAAHRELERPAPKVQQPPVARSARNGAPGAALAGVQMRITYRTLRVLAVIGQCPAASNRQIADQAGVSDQGQISKLLARLEGLGLVENTSDGQPSGEPNAWHLTALGQQVKRATQAETAREVHGFAPGAPGAAHVSGARQGAVAGPAYQSPVAIEGPSPRSSRRR
jgi:AcrR family transcriptional regulator